MLIIHATLMRLAPALLLLTMGVAVVAVRLPAADDPISFSGATMGTRYLVRAASLPAGVDSGHLHAAIERCLERVNDQMSTWRQDSELCRFNRYRGTDWFAVSPQTAEVIAAAIRISNETGGTFDATVGRLVNLWQFGPEERIRPPTDEEIAAALQTVGSNQLQVRLDPPAVRKTQPLIYVDLSGIAKGFGVDEVARLLDEQGVLAYMIEIGGEIRTMGKKSGGSGWRIGIEAPVVDRRSVQRTVELSGQSLATSGDYRNFREFNGRRVAHTIDPRTGRPVEHALASVTVVADTCLEADALATALMVLGPHEAYDWALQRDLAALLVVRDAERFAELPTPEFARLFPLDANESRGLPMVTFLFALMAFGVAIAAMAVGVLFGKRRLRGTCGGLANLRDAAGRPMCDACHDPAPSCGGVDEGRRRAAVGTTDSTQSDREGGHPEL